MNCPLGRSLSRILLLSLPLLIQGCGPSVALHVPEDITKQLYAIPIDETVTHLDSSEWKHKLWKDQKEYSVVSIPHSFFVGGCISSNSYNWQKCYDFDPIHADYSSEYVVLVGNKSKTKTFGLSEVHDYSALVVLDAHTGAELLFLKRHGMGQGYFVERVFIQDDVLYYRVAPFRGHASTSECNFVGARQLRKARP